MENYMPSAITFSLLILTCLTVTAVTQSVGKPQPLLQPPRPYTSETEPRWSTQRSNYFPGVDQDLTLTPPSTASPNFKFIFPGRFQPIIGARGANAPNPEENVQESRVTHNYYPPSDTAGRGGNYNPIYAPTEKSPVYLPPTTSTTVRATSTEATITAAQTQTHAQSPSPAASASGNSPFTLPTPAPNTSENREIRFLIHKPGDEEIIKRALYEDSMTTGEQLSFLQGPTIKLQQTQKVVLPPKRKTVVYVFIKEPEVETKVEMVEPPETAQEQPQVFIFYQKANAGKPGQKETFFYPKPKSAGSVVPAVSVGGASISAKQGNLNKAPAASNQISQTVDPPPLGCPPTHFAKN